MPSLVLAQDTPESEDIALALQGLTERANGRYLVSGAHCTDLPSSNWPGYESVPTQTIKSCRYEVESCDMNVPRSARADCRAHRHITGKIAATVVVLEPALDRFARWIASACKEVGGGRRACINTLVELGHGNANWQIPIAGIVFEGREGNHYVQYGYAFRDGLTVRSDAKCNWTNGSGPDNELPEVAPTAAQDTTCATSNTLPEKVSRLARPLGTTRDEVVAWHAELESRLPPLPGTETLVPGAEAQAWRIWVRETLAAAVSADSNPLVTAKAYALKLAGAF